MNRQRCQPALAAAGCGTHLFPLITKKRKGLKLFLWFPPHCVNDNHPVLHSMRQELEHLRSRYNHQPSDFNRYQLVRHEQRLAQWVPNDLLTA